MDKIEEISKRRKKAHEKLTSLKSKTYKAFLEMEKGKFFRLREARKANLGRYSQPLIHWEELIKKGAFLNSIDELISLISETINRRAENEILFRKFT